MTSLQCRLESGELSGKQLLDELFGKLVSGNFDVETNYAFKSPEVIQSVLDDIFSLDFKLQAEIWSILKAVIGKSTGNVEVCSRSGLISRLLSQLINIESDSALAELYTEILSLLASYSIGSSDLVELLSHLGNPVSPFDKNSRHLLSILSNTTSRFGPDEFFDLPGRENAGIALPPLARWPQSFTFCTWLRMDPVNRPECDKPYIYAFRTSAGIGYSAHLLGDCLILTAIKGPRGKGYQHAVPVELASRRWQHLVVCYSSNRWRGGEINCFIDGNLTTSVEVNWRASTNDIYDKCFIGSAFPLTQDDHSERGFSGQMSSIYLFSTALTSDQVGAIYALGPAYKGQFRHSTDCDLLLSESQRRLLYDDTLSSSIICCYSPRGSGCQICLDASPKSQAVPSFFVHSPHAQLQTGVKAIVTSSIYSSLHSLGGIQIFFPLFSKLAISGSVKENGLPAFSELILDFVFALLKGSSQVRQQLITTKAFMVLGVSLQTADAESLNLSFLHRLIDMMHFLQAANSDALLKHLLDFIFLNAALWINSPSCVQSALYMYLATDFISGPSPFTSSRVRRVSAVLQMLHTLKYYYWVKDPLPKSGVVSKTPEGLRLLQHDVLAIRSYIILFIKNLMTLDPNDGIDEEHIQSILNYLATLHEEENIHDVLSLLLSLAITYPSATSIALDRKYGVRALFKLVTSSSEIIRIKTVKVLVVYLSNIPVKRKMDIMRSYGLFELLAERMMLYCESITVPTYNVMMELVTQSTSLQVYYKVRPPPYPTASLVNPHALKTIATMIQLSQKDLPEILDIQKRFILDMTGLFSHNRENRRRLLQCSVWQDWLIGLAYVYPNNNLEKAVTDAVYTLLCILLHHAVKFEYGGWRVWIDTMAIVHSKVTYETYKRRLRGELLSPSSTQIKNNETSVESNQHADVEKEKSPIRKIESNKADSEMSSPSSNESNQSSPKPELEDPNLNKLGLPSTALDQPITKLDESVDEDDDLQKSVRFKESRGNTSLRYTPSINVVRKKSILKRKTNSSPPEGKTQKRQGFRLPEFSWSNMHQRLLSDLLFSIETEVAAWRLGGPKTVAEAINCTSNNVFVHNVVHIISQLSDTLVFSTGGILYLLSAATSQKRDIGDHLESNNRGLSAERSFSFIHRLASLADAFVFNNSASFSSLEAEKNMSGGGIMRQCLRLISWIAIRNCLECRRRYANNLLNSESSNGVLLAAFSPEAQLTSKPLVISDINLTIQEIDLTRIKATVYKDSDDIKHSEFMALATVYLLSILMVGRYRDILEPEKVPSNLISTPPFVEVHKTKLDSKQTHNKLVSINNSIEKPDEKDSSEEEFEDVDLGTPINVSDDEEKSNKTVPKAKVKRSATWSGDSVQDAEEVSQDDLGLGTINLSPDLENKDDATHSDNAKLSNIDIDIPKPASSARAHSLSKELESSLAGASTLLREIFFDFSHFLSRTLVGSHGQELLIEGLTALKGSQSIVELVMMLCSQEWQNAIQKLAGISFLELVNEGRLISLATQSHLVRVAVEASDILSRDITDVTNKQAEFEARCATLIAERRSEDQLCDRLITAARRRDANFANKALQKATHLLFSRKSSNSSQNFYRLDYWEDNMRRRRRFILNPVGSSHSSAALKSNEDTTPRQLKSDLPPEIHSRLAAFGKGSATDNEDVSDPEDVLQPLPTASAYPVVFTSQCTLIHTVIQAPGTLSITPSELLYDVDVDSVKSVGYNLLSACDVLHYKWSLSEIKAIFLRKYILQPTALEIFFANRTTVMFNFQNAALVRQAVDALPQVGIGTKYGAPQSKKMSLASPRTLFRACNMTERWQKREISNFQYLMYLNTITGRTYNDLNQYPIFPWVLTNYTSEHLDLSLPSNYRDLTKPIGAINPDRAQTFKNRFDNWEDDTVSPFHYGTHYSNAAFTLSWLVRCEPFTSLLLQLQGGRFDHADRTFNSVEQAWKNCQQDTSDVKELIPELFYLPEMFRNTNKFPLGLNSDGDNDVSGDVILPPWANGSPEEFVRIHRAALESDVVSCQLNHWIDLIFGFKQRGTEAVKALNVFYYLTYEGSARLDEIDDPIMKEAVVNQIKNFGQTPSQLMTEPHPSRSSLVVLNPALFKQFSALGTSAPSVSLKFISNSPIVHIAANNHSAVPSPSIVTLAENHTLTLNKWTNESLPVTLDSVQIPRRLAVDTLDLGFRPSCNSFVVSSDNAFVFAVGFWDHTLRVFNVESGRLRQVIHGHYDVVTCVARTDCRPGGDCFLVTGSRDMTCLVWFWNSKHSIIVGEQSLIKGDYPMAKAVLIGHKSAVLSLAVSSELGMVLSASKQLLLHTLSGDLLRIIHSDDVVPRQLLFNTPSGYIVMLQSNNTLRVFSISGTSLSTQSYDEQLLAISCNHDGSFLICANNRNAIKVMRTHSLEVVHFFQIAEQLPISAIEISQDNKHIVCGLASGGIAVFRVNFLRWHPEYISRPEFKESSGKE